jgi:hydrocephalus-inducing protein
LKNIIINFLFKPNLETPFSADGIETNSGEMTSASQHPITGVDRTALNSAGEPTESIGDKSETVLKRVAEKIINYDMTPVAQALARHLGIDLTSDGIQARNRRGAAIIVHGPPGSGKERIIYQSEHS